ncbi:MAG: homoserine O-acetyltransferase [Aquimonas sp.]|nr:homoserine O-acetyltransferase [Aquimonas sp.]
MSTAVASLPATAPDSGVLDLGTLPLEGGCELPELRLAWRSWGRLNAAGDNAVLICHALTGDAEAASWWAPLFGPGRALDPQRDFILCSNALGGCRGSSGPTSTAPNGQAWGGRFPAISLRDQVEAQRRLADAFGIRAIRLVLGGSMGALQALEWAAADVRVQAFASVAGSARHSAWCLAWNEAQRQAIEADPEFRGGAYAPERPPRAGLAAARAIAMATYRSAASLEQRFGRDDGAARFGERAAAPDDFAVRNWLRHHGRALNARFDANSYLRLLDALDSHDVGRDRGGVEAALARIRVPALVVSIPGDQLYVPADQYQLAEGLASAELAVLPSAHGHDGFLLDAERLEPLLRRFRQRLGQ